MNKTRRITALAELGQLIKEESPTWEPLKLKAKSKNLWFTIEHIDLAFEGLLQFLSLDNLQKWASNYPESNAQKNIGLVLAGNLPLVGFHDVLCVLVSGHHAQIKCSSQDEVLIPDLLEKLVQIEPSFASQFSVVPRLQDFDAVIATGSDNTARYFEHYFGKYPNIIRKNRTSIGVLDGTETREDLKQIGHDLFDYFGLGCRNISKIFVPEGYDIKILIEALSDFDFLSQHNKYANNYDYQKSIYLVNKVAHLDNGFALFKEEKEALVSPLSVVFYEQYTNMDTLNTQLEQHKDKLQCVVSKSNSIPNSILPGQSQRPTLQDYADNVDTMSFLTSM